MAQLVADMAQVPGDVLDRACEAWRKKSEWFPATAELLNECRMAVDAAKPASGTAREDALREKAWAYNRANAEKGSPFRWSGRMDCFRMGDPGERRGTRPDGSVIEPFVGPMDKPPEHRRWWCRAEDREDLAASYRAAGVALRLNGNEIVEPSHA